MDLPNPLPDDSRTYITAWICWQGTVHEASADDLAAALNDAQVPSWLGLAWTPTAIAYVQRRTMR